MTDYMQTSYWLLVYDKKCMHASPIAVPLSGPHSRVVVHQPACHAMHAKLTA